jgi:hypothetical protein
MKEESVDKRVKLYNAILGLIPGGSFLSAYVIDRIPGQRMERLFEFIEEASKRIEKLENRSFVHEDSYGQLVESTIIEATKPISKERMDWLTSILIPTETPSELEIEFRRKALGILSDLSDSDIEYLLKHKKWEDKVRYERSFGGKHFISVAEFNKSTSHEIFTKFLENERLDFSRKSLQEKRLIENTGRQDAPDFKLTMLGNSVIYVLTNEYPGK